jgi:hypothetical protein
VQIVEILAGKHLSQMISMKVKRKRNQLRKKAATVKCAGKVIAEAKVIVAIK